MRTERLIVMPYESPLSGQFIGWMCDATAEAFLSKSFEHRPQGRALFEAFLSASRRSSKEHRVWAIVLWSGELVGHVEAKESEKTREGQLELVYAVRNEHSGLGIASEAVALIASSLAGRGIAPVAFINPANSASRRVLQKANFELVPLGIQGHGEQWSYPINVG